MNNFLLLNIQDLFHRLPIYGEHGFDVTGYLVTLAGWSSVIGVLLAILTMLVFFVLNRCGSKGRRHVISGKFLTCSFIVVWLAGFVIYDVGLYIGDSRWSLLTNVPMAIIHAFEMFVLESDVAAIHTEFHHNWIFMAAFSLVHALAAVITLVFVIKHFGYNIVAGFRMAAEAYLGRKKESFIFWGLNNASCQLAESIKQHFGNSRDYRIIVVRTNDEKDGGVKNGMERLFNFLSLENNDLERLQQLDCLTTSTYADLAELNIDVSAGEDVLRRRMSLKLLSRIIRRKSSGHLHLFFLSDTTNDNIQEVANLKHDLTILNYADGPGHMVTLYCRARYNSIHRVIEDEQHHDSLEVKVIDSSHISVEILKQHVEFHPVNYVDICPDATVSSAFNALVIGFGEVGVEALRFLYEFGAFVKSGGGPVQRSDFHCDVVDPDMDRLAGLFMANAPSVATNMSSCEKSLITMYTMDALSVEFYRMVQERIQDLNYVVIAQGDDELNISLAVRIFRLAVRYRQDMKRLRIMVHVKNDEEGHFRRIAEHYNRLWLAEENSEDWVKRIHQCTVTATESPGSPITLFGQSDEIYAYDYIVSDRLKSEARAFKDRYDKSVERLTGQRPGSTPDWETEKGDLMQLTGEYIGFSPTYSGIMRLRRTQYQNLQNCFHLLTKRLLAQAALGDLYGVFADGVLKREENKTTYTWQGDAQPNDQVIHVLDVLARTEHLRWVASHEVLGYSDSGTEDDKDEARLTHGCLKPWEQLTPRTQSYDYNIVDVSLGIM